MAERRRSATLVSRWGVTPGKSGTSDMSRRRSRSPQERRSFGSGQDSSRIYRLRQSQSRQDQQQHLADAGSSLWVAHSEEEERDRQRSATVVALAAIGPKDELEGMIATQLLAAHNATMECYRRAMIPEQTVEGRSENAAVPILPISKGDVRSAAPPRCPSVARRV
jgi:hypothetical protein